MTDFSAYRVHVSDEKVQRKLETCSIDDLPAGEVLIKVEYSSLNYKDALSASGHRGVTRHYPHTPGIDAAGKVVSDESETFQRDERVAVIGFDLGMNTWGGFSQYVRVPAAWVVRLPDEMSCADAMRLGTAGVTAAYAVEKLLINGLTGSSSNVLVTGATGGVGSIAVHLLASLGYRVVASTGKSEQAQWLKELGAYEVINRQTLSEHSNKALLSGIYDAAIDTVGQDTLVNIIKSLKFNGTVAACGIVGGTQVPLDIYPFILRGVNFVGIASADAPLEARKVALARFTGPWKLPNLASMCDEISLSDLSERIDAMLAGQVSRRALVKLH